MKIFKYYILIILVISLFSIKSWAGWSKADIGSRNEGMDDLAVGNGRNDGVSRVYGGYRDGLYEFTWSGGSWDSPVELGSGDNDMNTLTIGNGRNDSTSRVYGTNDDSHIYEFSWLGSSWTKADVGTAGGFPMHGVAIGNGRNDGEMRTYGISWKYIYEYSWSGSSWTRVEVSSGNSFGQVAIGNGKNDGVNRIYMGYYSSSPDTWSIDEYSWAGSSWTKINVSTFTDYINSLVIDSGRNDGISRLYGSCDDNHIYEFSWSGSSWTKTDVGSGDSSMWGITIGEGRNDGISRLYGSCDDDNVYEFSWSGSSWIKKTVGSDPQREMRLGDGRDDGILRLYGDYWEGGTVPVHIYEFTYSNEIPTLSWTGETNYSTDGIYPNSSLSLSTFTYRVKYTDSDNYQPKSGYPKLHILKGGLEITDSPFLMTGVSADDVDYTDSKLYTFSINLSAGSDYTYYFEAYDLLDDKATGTPTEVKNGPIVESGHSENTAYEEEVEDTEKGIKVKVIVPNNAFNIPTTIEIIPIESGHSKYYLITEADAKVPHSSISQAYEFIVKDTDLNELSNDDFKNNVTIEFAYPSSLPLAVVNQLTIFRLNETTKEWEELSNCSIDTDNNTISVDVSHFSIYKLMAKTARNLDTIIVYPNPFRVTEAVGGCIKFINLPSEITLRIYDVAGDLLFDKHYTNTQGGTTWNGKDNGGHYLASGIYIYFLEDTDGNKKTGKISVLR